MPATELPARDDSIRRFRYPCGPCEIEEKDPHRIIPHVLFYE
jgi:hypothetical protein